VLFSEFPLICYFLFSELLDRVDAEGVDFLKEPIRESWIYLSTRFKLLEKAAERKLQNVFQKLKIRQDEISKLSKKQQAFIQYLTAEKATLGCFAEVTSKQIQES